MNNVLCIRIIDTDNDLKLYIAEAVDVDKDLNDKILVIPFEIFDSINEKPIEQKYADKNLGLVTYAKVVSMRGNTIILDRQTIVDERSKEFKDKQKLGDKIICEYKNTVYKGKELKGIYVLFEKTVKGFIPKIYLKNINKKYKINEEIEGYIVSINPKNQFILNENEVNVNQEKLISKKIYLGKLIDIFDEHYIFECNGVKVVVSKTLDLELNSYARIFVKKSIVKKNIRMYYGSISS